MLYNNKATDQKKPRPNCDMCAQTEPAAVDGKTDFGPWAYMCVDHYQRHGVGLGMGLGQVLLCDDGHDPLLRARYDLGTSTHNPMDPGYGMADSLRVSPDDTSPGDPHQSLIDDGSVEF